MPQLVLGLLSIFSVLYLGTVLTFSKALVEQESWGGIWRETRRRWLKLMGILIAIALVTQALTFFSQSVAF